MIRRFCSLADLSDQRHPFGSFTVIGYRMPGPGDALLQIFDPADRLVRTLASGHIGAGSHWSNWDGRDETGVIMGSGVHLYRSRPRRRLRHVG